MGQGSGLPATTKQEVGRETQRRGWAQGRRGPLGACVCRGPGPGPVCPPGSALGPGAARVLGQQEGRGQPETPPLRPRALDGAVKQELRGHRVWRSKASTHTGTHGTPQKPTGGGGWGGRVGGQRPAGSPSPVGPRLTPAPHPAGYLASPPPPWPPAAHGAPDPQHGVRGAGGLKLGPGSRQGNEAQGSHRIWGGLPARVCWGRGSPEAVSPGREGRDGARLGPGCSAPYLARRGWQARSSGRRHCWWPRTRICPDPSPRCSRSAGPLEERERARPLRGARGAGRQGQPPKYPVSGQEPGKVSSSQVAPAGPVLPLKGNHRGHPGQLLARGVWATLFTQRRGEAAGRHPQVTRETRGPKGPPWRRRQWNPSTGPKARTPTGAGGLQHELSPASDPRGWTSGPPILRTVTAEGPRQIKTRSAWVQQCTLNPQHSGG